MFGFVQTLTSVVTSGKITAKAQIAHRGQGAIDQVFGMAGQFVLIVVFGVVPKRIHSSDIHGFDVGRKCSPQAVSDHGCSVTNVQACDITTYGRYTTSGQGQA